MRDEMHRHPGRAGLADLLKLEERRAGDELAAARLCTAIVDRLTFNANIIETGTDSFRLRTTTGRQRG